MQPVVCRLAPLVLAVLLALLGLLAACGSVDAPPDAPIDESVDEPVDDPIDPTIDEIDSTIDVEETIEEALDEFVGPSQPPETIRYVALGDSIAVGTGAETSYVAEYADWLEGETGSTVHIDNRGVNGWTSADVLEALRTDVVLRAALADAHLITFNIGGNDLLNALADAAAGRCGGEDGQACLRVAVTEVQQTWDELLVEITEVTDGDLSGVRTMDIYRPALLDGLGPFVVVLQHHLDEVNEHLATSAADAGIPMASVHDAFRARADAAGTDDDHPVSHDLIHPSDRGHELIADELAALGTELRDVDPTHDGPITQE